LSRRVRSQPSTGSREWRSPGLAALFGGLTEDGGHCVLDLGPGSGAHLGVLRAFATQVRFADILPDGTVGETWDEALRTLPPHPFRPYDVVLAWDVLDRLEAERRAALVIRLDALTGPRARLHAVAGAEGPHPRQAVRFVLLGRDRIREEDAGVMTRPIQPLLPAQMTRVLEPFEVVSAFTLRNGSREYVAKKGA
jgi:hypothetical protein